jgi:hypothetical protein
MSCPKCPTQDAPFAERVRHLLEDMRGERPRMIDGKPVYPPALPPISSARNARHAITALLDELWMSLPDDTTQVSRRAVVTLFARIGAVVQMAAEDLGFEERR